MRTKKVNRYWCDFCNKAGLRSHSMLKHELHCTLNPNRKCRACQFVNGGSGCDLEEVIAMLPDPTEYNSHMCGEFGEDNAYTRLVRAVEEVMPKVRELTDGCPACIMAALRQKKIPVPMVESFDFAKEMKDIFYEANTADMQCYGWY